MLHEILLSLSGLQSPVWTQASSAAGAGDEKTFNQYVSPPERAMLATLAHLHDLHVQIKEATSRLSTAHRSMVCRAVSSSIADVHLGKYVDKIIEVESCILQKDAAYVGAYEVVPLSTLVAEFAPWTRRLEWLWSVVLQLDPQSKQNMKNRSPSGASILDWLGNETHTGYSDIEDMAIALLTVAQKAWMRAASLWVLYGRLPTSGAEDFCIRPNPNPSSVMDSYMIDHSLTPKILNPGTSSALLSAGCALSQLYSQTASFGPLLSVSSDASLSLLPTHLALLESLHYPLNPSLLESTISSINQSISENALSQILPRPLVMQLLQVVLRYMLLNQGEFAVSLIKHADERVASHRQPHSTVRPVRKIGRLDELAIKEAELKGILNKTMAELSALQADDDIEDDTLNLAKKLLSLQAVDENNELGRGLVSTLLPTPTFLHLTIPTSSALHIFLSSSDVQRYASINAYLISIHRAGLHLSSLWKLSSHRRCYPSPIGPPRSASQSGRERLAARRARDARRSTRTRAHWTTASRALFMINELEAFLQGEVIQSSWTHFSKWLDGNDGLYPSSAKSSRPGTASSTAQTGAAELSNREATTIPTDPRAMAEAHRRYLHALRTALFLTNDAFVATLKELLNQTDHFIALFSRLQTVWEGLDLQEDEGVLDAFSNYAKDERDVLAEMDRTRKSMENTISGLVENIRDMEKEKRTGVGFMTSSIQESMDGLQLNGNGTKFMPWQARTVDRLVMKLDGLVMKQDEDRDHTAVGLVDAYDE
ncbi:uncharacterized protein Z520_02876 [Fonsecaea multimorphosa CBS 102226]|uniref:Spindle pole body component n=1 Tax=Fonsecaea multimorphosa CBS 102226 TaxID=1442371 RepID=A0A0D2KWX5_9EURO|nr:uncharacterized protein Z520_02876 [Fonsecaea multimorphosa CBS 102226]KIY01324.1 hypothetical protein Z520_02876 [Fonsecaea multimorphosa CBS 102226]OAL28601.1 hypothetical protein AYO22_02795 [Fonsecaea multimorphosa]